MLVKPLKYIFVLILIMLSVHAFAFIEKLAVENRYNPFFSPDHPFLIYVTAEIIRNFLPVLTGVLIGGIHLLLIRKREGRWRFNWYLFILVVVPLLAIPICLVLVSLHVINPVINFIVQALPSRFNVSLLLMQLTGILFMYCFYKNKDLVE